LHAKIFSRLGAANMRKTNFGAHIVCLGSPCRKMFQFCEKSQQLNGSGGPISTL